MLDRKEIEISIEPIQPVFQVPVIAPLPLPNLQEIMERTHRVDTNPVVLPNTLLEVFSEGCRNMGHPSLVNFARFIPSVFSTEPRIVALVNKEVQGDNFVMVIPDNEVAYHERLQRILRP
jgi:hypothetical protein